MTSGVPYDSLAEIYDVWVANYGPVMDQTRAFYARQYAETDGPAVELGVGNGRILIEAAAAGKQVIGVDYSTKMLSLCHRKAIEAGVAERIELVKADFRHFDLAEPAALIAIPYDSIGHMVSSEEKLACFQHVRSQLAPGGRFILDHNIFDAAAAAANDRKARLQFVYADAETGNDVLLWLVTIYDLAKQANRTFVWTEAVGFDGSVTKRMLGSVENSWLDAEALCGLLRDAGFEIEADYGDFDGGSLGNGSRYHVCIARRGA